MILRILLTQIFLSTAVFASLEAPQHRLPMLFEKTLEKSFSPKTCFTPGQNCTKFILQIIKQAQTSILVQAYEFTSLNIAQELCQAMQRGVKVEILIDRRQLTQKSSQLNLLKQAGIPIYIDKVPGIAHNKVMIIDHKTVLTGSFNWTDSAQIRNAENLIWIADSRCVQAYLDNWQIRRQEAIDIQKLNPVKPLSL